MWPRKAFDPITYSCFHNLLLDINRDAVDVRGSCEYIRQKYSRNICDASEKDTADFKQSSWVPQAFSYLVSIFQPFHHHFAKFVRVLADQPMSSFNVPQLKPREKTPNDGQRFVCNVYTLGAAHEQSRTFVSYLIGIRVGKIHHRAERSRKGVQRYTPH